MSRYVLSVHIHPYMNKTSYIWKLVKNWWIIFIVSPASARDYNSEDQATASENFITSHTTLQRSGYCFWRLILRLTRHFRDIHHYKYDIILISISFPHPSVSWVIYYILSRDNIHSEFTVIQYTWLANYGNQREHSIRSIISGVSLFQGFRNTRVQEFRSSRVSDIW